MTIHIGIVGAGRRGHAHREGLSRVPGVRVVGVADPDLERARELAALDGAVSYPDFRHLLDRDDLDAVCVASPVRAHTEQALAVAERGLGLLLEKPVAWTLPEALRIADAVDRAGITAMVSYQWRHMPAVARLIERLGGRPIALLRAHWYWTIPLVPAIRDKATGGGQIVDQATHLIDLMRLFAGEVCTVQAAYTLNARRGEFDNWDGYSVTLDFHGGAVGSIGSTYALHPDVAEPPTLDVVAREMLLRLTPGQLEVRTPEGLRTTNDAGGANDTLATHRFDAEFIAALTNGGPGTEPPGRTASTVRSATHTLAVCLAANHAAATGQPVNMQKFLTDHHADQAIEPS